MFDLYTKILNPPTPFFKGGLLTESQMTTIHYSEVKKNLLQKPQTWLITGVAGFIGGHLLKTLLELHQHVVGLDNFATSTPDHLKRTLAQIPPALQANFKFIEGDILSASLCQDLMNQVDIVLHQAAIASVPVSMENPRYVHDVNTQGFLNILIGAKEARVKRLVYSSSCAVYGNSPEMPKTEKSPLNPLSPYAATKASNEMYAGAFSNAYGLETIGLRYFNVFGPHQNPEGPYAAVIPLWIKAMHENQPICIYGDGSSSRDFCYVEDVVQANILAAITQQADALNTIYNVASGTQTTLNQLCEMLKQSFNKPNHPVEFLPYRVGDIRHSWANIEKIKSLLNYQPTKIAASLLTPAAMQIPYSQ